MRTNILSVIAVILFTMIMTSYSYGQHTIKRIRGEKFMLVDEKVKVTPMPCVVRDADTLHYGCIYTLLNNSSHTKEATIELSLKDTRNAGEAFLADGENENYSTPVHVTISESGTGRFYPLRIKEKPFGNGIGQETHATAAKVECDIRITPKSSKKLMVRYSIPLCTTPGSTVHDRRQHLSHPDHLQYFMFLYALEQCLVSTIKYDSTPRNTWDSGNSTPVVKVDATAFMELQSFRKSQLIVSNTLSNHPRSGYFGLNFTALPVGLSYIRRRIGDGIAYDKKDGLHALSQKNGSYKLQIVSTCLPTSKSDCLNLLDNLSGVAPEVEIDLLSSVMQCYYGNCEGKISSFVGRQEWYTNRSAKSKVRECVGKEEVLRTLEEIKKSIEKKACRIP